MPTSTNTKACNYCQTIMFCPYCDYQVCVKGSAKTSKKMLCHHLERKHGLDRKERQKIFDNWEVRFTDCFTEGKQKQLDEKFMTQFSKLVPLH